MKMNVKAPFGATGEKKPAVTRAEKRALMKKKSLARELLMIIHSYFPFLLNALRHVKDPRNSKYINYDISILLLERIMSAIFSDNSMRTQTYTFNDENMIKNIATILKRELDELPHHDTINNCFELLGPSELEGLIKKMANALIRRNTFSDSRVRGKYWQILVDGTTLSSFPHKHCDKCLFRRYKNKKGDIIKVEFYHCVLEAKLVLHENLVFSICSVFIENTAGIPDEAELYSRTYDEPSYEKKKQSCELKAFYDISVKLKEMFPRLPICITADGLYPCKQVFQICKDNNWHYILRFKEGCIPTLYKSYQSYRCIVYKDRVWHKTVNDKTIDYFYAIKLTYDDFTINVAECIDSSVEYPFLFITDLPVNRDNCEGVIMAGRRRWRIENEGFKVQKQHGYYLKHMFSHNYNAMKIHYFLIQIAHSINQLLEHGVELFKTAGLTKAQIHKKLLDAFKFYLLTEDDLLAAEIPQKIRLEF